MNRLGRWLGYGLLGIFGLLVVAAAGVYGVSEYRIQKRYDVVPAISAFQPRAEPAVVTRGQHIATIRGCVDCHGQNLGGRLFLDAPPVATVYAANLTRGEGGIGGTYTDADWDRAIRHGIGPDRKPLMIMPSQEFHVLSDEDLEALVAYIKNMPPVDFVPGKNTFGPLGRLLFVMGQVDAVPAELIDHAAPRATAPAEGPTAEYGAYLATGCIGCHGTGYSGGRIPGMPPEFPPASNITFDRETGIGAWSRDDFARALREGVRPDGSTLLPEMPVTLTSQMTDDELTALYLYLKTVPVKPLGNR